jgi:hypothetical protein
VVFERLDHLPRIRWATEAVVVTDPDQRVALLSEGVAPERVVLSAQPDAPLVGGGADVRAVVSDTNRVDVEVATDDGGYLVVADSIQDGWRASIDGVTVPILDADHAVGAVAVPPGTHSVRLAYDPKGRSIGAVVTLIALLVSLGVVGASVGRRLTRPRDGDEVV